MARSWLENHSHVAVLFLLVIIVSTVLVLAECGLRLLGYEYTRRPINLVLDNSFRVQERGLFVANPLSKKHAGLDINSDGFRSPEFSDDLPSARKTLRLVILGDSFTWGASATPISESFPDLLRNAGYQVHNLGIPGIGPRQYRRMADEYLSRLKPDVVVVALFLGNDFLDAQWEPPFGLPPYYVIEGGDWIPTMDDNGGYIESVEAAYEHFHNKFGKIRRFLRETVIGTLAIKLYRRVMASIYVNNSFDIWSPWLRNAHAQHGDDAHASDEEDLLQRYAVTYQALEHVQSLADEVGAEYFTLVIPSLGPGCLSASDFNLETQKKMLRDFRPVYSDLSIDHYRPIPDCHLNNAGHLVMARRLEKLLRTLSLDSTRRRRLLDPCDDSNGNCPKRRQPGRSEPLTRLKSPA